MNYTDLSGKLNPDCYTAGRDGNQVLALIAHNTCGPNDINPGNQALSDAAASYLCSNTRQVSVHWLVGAEGCGAPIYRIVPEGNTAYHCGGSPPQYPSTWIAPGGKSYGGYGLNQVTIGIEVFGQASDTLGPNQLTSLKALVKDIVSRYPILKDPLRIVAHASLEGDRTDGRNWVNLAKQWVQEAPDQPQPAADVIMLNGFAIGHGFKDFFNNNGGVRVLGLPLTNEFTMPDGITRQVFERYVLTYDPKEANPDWRIKGQDVGRFWLNANAGKLPV